MPGRRFPPPWKSEEGDACFIVRDAAGRALAYVYFEDEPGRRCEAAGTRRGQAHRREYRQAAGAARQVTWSTEKLRGWIAKNCRLFETLELS
jgi:uncharacterized membrane protein